MVYRKNFGDWEMSFFVPVDRPLLFRSHAKLVCLIATIYSEVDSDVDVMSMIYPESAIIR